MLGRKCRRAYMTPFLTRKTIISEKKIPLVHFFALFILSRASDNTASQNIGGDGSMGRPSTSIFLGGPRSPPLALDAVNPRPAWLHFWVACFKDLNLVDIKDLAGVAYI